MLWYLLNTFRWEYWSIFTSVIMMHVHELGHKAKRMIVVLTLVMCEVKEQACVSVIVYFHLICQNKTNVWILVQNKDLFPVLTSFLCKRDRYCFGGKQCMCISASFRFLQVGCCVVGGTATLLSYDYEKTSKTSVCSLSGPNTQIQT